MSAKPHQIFISYAQIDDEAPPNLPNAKGFVSSLREQLVYETRQLSGEELSFWQASSLAISGQQFGDQIKDAVAASSLLLVVLSRNWLASAWCKMEFDSFITRWRVEGELGVKHRIIVVGKHYVPYDQRPSLLQGQEGFSFYARSDPGNLTPEVSLFARGAIQDTRYEQRIEELARYLVRRIHALGAQYKDRGEVISLDSSQKQVADALTQTVARQSPADSASPDPTLSRTQPEYWLHRVENERHLQAGDEPIVLISFASEDQLWIDELHAFIEPRLADLLDGDGRPYQLWNFSDAKRGTTPGDEFPEIVAEKMWRCRAAVIVLSRDYTSSKYCRNIELPFLMWRWEHHKLMCLPIKVGTVPIDKVRVPAYMGPARRVILDEIIDDRQAPEHFSASPHRDLNLKELKEVKLEAEIEKRFDGVGRRIIAYLKQRYAARDDD
jgi:hypothetical protein